MSHFQDYNQDEDSDSVDVNESADKSEKKDKESGDHKNCPEDNIVTPQLNFSDYTDTTTSKFGLPNSSSSLNVSSSDSVKGESNPTARSSLANSDSAQRDSFKPIVSNTDIPELSEREAPGDIGKLYSRKMMKRRSMGRGHSEPKFSSDSTERTRRRSAGDGGNRPRRSSESSSEHIEASEANETERRSSSHRNSANRKRPSEAASELGSSPTNGLSKTLKRKSSRVWRRSEEIGNSAEADTRPHTDNTSDPNDIKDSSKMSSPSIVTSSGSGTNQFYYDSDKKILQNLKEYKRSRSKISRGSDLDTSPSRTPLTGSSSGATTNGTNTPEASDLIKKKSSSPLCCKKRTECGCCSKAQNTTPAKQSTALRSCAPKSCKCKALPPTTPDPPRRIILELELRYWTGREYFKYLKSDDLDDEERYGLTSASH